MPRLRVRSAIGAQVHSFRRTAERETWLKDHQEAMDCLDFEQFVGVGVFLYDKLRELEAKLSERAAASGHRDEQETMEILLELWRLGARFVDVEIRRYESKGYEVDHAQELRDRIEALDREFVLREQSAINPTEIETAADRLKRGEGVSLEDFKRDLLGDDRSKPRPEVEGDPREAP